MFRLTIKTDNAAFEGCERDEETARILEEIARDIREGCQNGKCRDINGNTVGEWGFGK